MQTLLFITGNIINVKQSYLQRKNHGKAGIMNTENLTNNISTKDKVLKLLKENANSYISGQDIADRLYITRAGIWKIIKKLKEEGYDIESVTNRGYRLSTSFDTVNADFIKEELAPGICPEFHSFTEVSSTNDVAKEIFSTKKSFHSVYEESFSSSKSEDKKTDISDDKKHNKNSKENIFTAGASDILVISDSQTSGRGRKGRSFYSPKDTGVYLSLLIRPEIPFSKATYLTCIAAESIVLSIKEVLNIDVTIKWVNDIFFEDRKIAGILTETFGSLEEEYPEYIIVGVGINVYPFSGKMPASLKNKAGFLIKDGKPIDNLKNLLCIHFVRNFYRFLKEFDTKSFLEGYRAHSNLIGKYVVINPTADTAAAKSYALVTGIDDNCRLLVKYDDGKKEALLGKDVSVVKY
ncbi:MAG: biotin--[acetyl-CoA-carboxylase] ligase [Lachnospiraceae bacterium]|nr:biotin--[acetyl-CoA-carboxylase] ligase [Lachnospiraceae bacterium]